MTLDRREWVGAWYGESLPNGRYVITYPAGQILVNEGSALFPGGILFARLMPNGRGFVGVGAEGAGVWKDHACEFANILSDPADRGSACGGSPCAYWPDGTLVISHCEPPYGSQGIRWIDHEIHTGDATYFDQRIPLWEWTEHDGIKVGQGGEGPLGADPCLIVYEGVRYLLEPGTCRAVRFNKDGDRLAIALFRMDLPAHVRYLLTVDQITTLPIYNPAPPDPVDPPKPPTCAIVTYPASVLHGQPAQVTSAYGGGPAAEATWSFKAEDALTWTIAARQRPPETIFDYGPFFTRAGDYNIALRVDGPGGSDTTATERVVSVLSPVPPEPTPMRRQVAFAPNIGSLDFQQLFTESNLWQWGWDRISSFHFYLQNVLDLDPVIVGPNTYDNLVAAGAFRKCKEAGLFTEVELAGPNTQVDEAVLRIAAAGGQLNGVVWDDCFNGITPEKFEEYLKAVRRDHPTILAGVFAPFPMRSAEQIRERFVEWDKRGCRPDFLRMDIGGAGVSRQFTKADYAILRDICTDRPPMTLQVVINAGDGLTDQQYVDRAWEWYKQVISIGAFDGFAVQSWASTQPQSTGPRTVPKNLLESETSSHTAFLRRVLENLP